MRFQILATLCCMAAASAASAQVGAPGIYYADSIAAGEGGQLFPYDQQDPWIHGQFQRMPAYGGHAAFRPFNYHHVFSQTQVAQRWGASHGLPYSQQFWNRYKTSFLEGNLHASAPPSQPVPQSPATPLISPSVYPSSFGQPSQPTLVIPSPAVNPVTRIGYQTQEVPAANRRTQ